MFNWDESDEIFYNMITSEEEFDYNTIVKNGMKNVGLIFDVVDEYKASMFLSKLLFKSEEHEDITGIKVKEVGFDFMSGPNVSEIKELVHRLNFLLNGGGNMFHKKSDDSIAIEIPEYALV